LVACRFFRLNDNRTFAADIVNEIVLVHDGLVAFGAGFSARLASCKVSCEGGDWDIELAVFAKPGFEFALFIVLLVISLREFLQAVRAFLLPVILLFVLLLEVNVEQLLANWAFLDVSSAVAEMSRHFGFGEVLEAIIASLKRFALHSFELFLNYNLLLKYSSNTRLNN
jgi:hypothetical protein